MEPRYRVERKENGEWTPMTDWVPTSAEGHDDYRKEADALRRRNTAVPVELRLAIQMPNGNIGRAREFVFYRGHAMNYLPNMIVWKPGDITVLDTDAKETAMVMVVLGYTAGGGVKTRYIFDRVGGSRLHKRVMTFNLWDLHDPARWPDKMDVAEAKLRLKSVRSDRQ